MPAEELESLVRADRSDLRRLLDELALAASAAEARASCHADSTRVRSAGRIDYDRDQATEAERQRVRSDPDVHQAVELWEAVRSVQHQVELAAEHLAELDGEREDY